MREGSRYDKLIRRGELPLPAGEIDASPRASGEGVSIERNAGAFTRAKGATSPEEGRGMSGDHAGRAQACELILRIPGSYEHFICMLAHQRRSRDLSRRRFQ